MNEGHAFDFREAFSQVVQVKQAARAVGASGTKGEVHFTVFSNIDVLNDFEFRVGPKVVRVFPSRENARHPPLKGDVFSAHGQPSVFVLDQGFGVFKTQFRQSPFHIAQFSLAALQQGSAFFEHRQRFIEVFSASLQLCNQRFKALQGFIVGHGFIGHGSSSFGSMV
jgi:hypothetical protein